MKKDIFHHYRSPYLRALPLALTLIFLIALIVLGYAYAREVAAGEMHVCAQSEMTRIGNGNADVVGYTKGVADTLMSAIALVVGFTYAFKSLLTPRRPGECGNRGVQGKVVGVQSMLIMALYYAVVSKDYSLRLCFRYPDGTERELIPLRYVYWATTLACANAHLEVLAGVGQWQYSVILTHVFMFAGMGSGMLRLGSPTASYFLLALAFAAYGASSIIKLRVSQGLFVGSPTAVKRNLRLGMPLIILQWCVIPILWVLEYAGVITSIELTFALYFAEIVSKLFVGAVISATMTAVYADDVMAHLTAADLHRVAATARVTAQRQILRYLFHELRVPLNTIVLGIRESEEQVEELAAAIGTRTSSVEFPQKLVGSMRQTLVACESGAMSMGVILDDFLSLEKIEAGAYVLETVPTDILKLVEDTGSRFKSAMAATGIALRFRTPSTLPGPVSVDPYKLRQCVSNFLSNAIKFSRPRWSEEPTSTITIVVRVVYAAAPEGAGMTDESGGSPSPRTAGPVWTRRRRFPVVSSSDEPPHTAFDASEAAPVRPPALYERALAFIDSAISYEGMLHDTQQPAAVTSPEEAAIAVTRESLSDGPGPGLSPFIYISVIDEGVGISEEDQGQLFQPFQQIQAGAQQKGNGTGLGLSIVRRIVELMGGRVGVVSEVGVGSEFYLCVPLVVAAEREDAVVDASNVRIGVDDSAPSPLPPAAHLTIVTNAVVVDDVKSNRMFLGRLLERRGVKTVHTCEDGVDAVEFAKALAAAGRLAEVQLWLLDEEMPRMNGSEAITQLRALGVSATIISVTGNALLLDQDKLRQAGADVVCTKPLDIRGLQAELKRHSHAFARE
jgi:signal transduction histidine kinase/CheY-like chemotaxis protein